MRQEARKKKVEQNRFLERMRKTKTFDRETENKQLSKSTREKVSSFNDSAVAVLKDLKEIS